MKNLSLKAWGLIVAALTFLFLEGFTSVIGDIFSFVHPYLYHLVSWTGILAPVEKSSDLRTFASVVVICALSLFAVTGLIYYLRQSFPAFSAWVNGNSNNDTIETGETGIETPYITCQDEISTAINSLDNKEPQPQKSIKMLSFMKRFEEEAQRIFKLEDGEFECVWILPPNNKSNHKFQIACLEKEIDDFYTFRILIESSLGQDDSRIVVEKVKQPVPQSKHEQFTIVKNFGKFRLGFAMLIRKENVFNEQNMQEFEDLSSYLLLLGFFEAFVATIRSVVRWKAS
ncbi:hypothetical protein CN918_25460 [Priestia megaterium]|nr:hypothetical protein CN918_25460 [Priestia megaterium]